MSQKLKTLYGVKDFAWDDTGRCHIIVEIAYVTTQPQECKSNTGNATSTTPDTNTTTPLQPSGVFQEVSKLFCSIFPYPGQKACSFL